MAPSTFWLTGHGIGWASALVASGVLVFATAMVQFGQAGTHIEPYKPTTTVVTDDVFRLAFLGMSEGATIQSKS